MTTLLTLIGAIAGMVGIGAALSRTIRFQADVKHALVTIIVNVAMPCMIVSSLFRLPVDAALLRQMGLTLFLSVAVHSLGLILGWAGSSAYQVSRQQRKELAILSGLGNTGFLGVPLCAMLFGAKGALLAAVFDIGLDIVIWTYVVWLLQSDSRWSWSGFKAAWNPPMIAILTGLMLAALHVPLPAVVKQLLDMLGQVTVPLAMLYIGLLLTELIPRRTCIRWLQLALPLSVKLVMLPVIVSLLMLLLKPDPDLTSIVLVQSAMPTLTIASIIFAKYSANEELAAITTVVSTVMAAVSVPLMIAWWGVLPL